MTIYTVHAPPLSENESVPDPERFAFVRDGFNFWAFVFGPLWMLWRRLWLALLFYVAIIGALEGVLWFIRAPAPMRAAVMLLIALLVGFEAATVRRWTLNRRGWRQLGVVAGSNYEAAERRFFDTWVTQMAWQVARTPPPSQQVSAISAGMSPPASDIIGLFPEPQSRQ